MRRRISLKFFITLAFLLMGMMLVLGYSLLSAYYFLRGMDSFMAGNMIHILHSYIQSVPAARRETPNRFSGCLIVQRWCQLPPDIQKAFGQPPDTADVLFKYEKSDWFRPPETLYFLMRHHSPDGDLFIVRRFDRPKASGPAGHNSPQKSLHILAAISVLIALTLGTIIWLLLRRVSQPVAALGRWTRELDSGKLELQPPDFFYPELNDLAELIRTSLLSVRRSLEREHRFLRHASHELRTPISIIRNNVELMEKLLENSGREWDPRQQQVIERIDRASLNMKHLTETLLWLSRDVAEPLPDQPVHPDRMIRRLVGEMRYLLSREVALKLVTHSFTIRLPEVPTRIVLGNLIRNAFQHTWEGRVTIRQQGNRVEIVNEQYGNDNSSQDLGFGLGLQLTAQLTAKLGWRYINEPGPQGHRAVVILGNTSPE